MRLTLSQARAQLGQLCTRAQDPREVIVLTRHDRPIAAIVSVQEAERIWDLGDTEKRGWHHPLAGLRGFWTRPSRVPEMELGLSGTYVSKREAANQVRDIQLTRATERRILKDGGLEPVEGGEIALPAPWWRRFRR